MEQGKVNRMSNRSISISEFKRWTTCRLRWSWASAPPRGLGLAPMVSAPELHLGRVVHAALQKGYDDKIPFEDAYRHIVSEQVEQEGSIFQDHLDKIRAEQELGALMLRGYQEWSEQQDAGMHFLATETNWDGIQLPGTEATMSGVFDALVELPSGLWVMDFKTTKSSITNWTEQDLQVTGYTYAAKIMYGPEVQGVIFRFLLKRVPDGYDKLILKNGAVTCKAGIKTCTDYKSYYRALGVAALQELVTERGYPFKGPHTLVAYNAALSEVQDEPIFKEHFNILRRVYFRELQSLRELVNPYFWDAIEPRTDIQIQNYMNNYFVPTAQEILNPSWVGPTGLAQAYSACAKCAFKVPCKLAMAGADYQSVLDDEYCLSPHYQEELDASSDDSDD